jgi:acyl dehydratase
MRDGVAVGDAATIEHAYSKADVAEYILISGDDNPIHRDGEAARRAGFEREVVHGILVKGLVSRVLGTDMPGPGTILLGLDLRYLRRVHVGDRTTMTLEVTSVREDKPIARLSVLARTPSGDVLSGEVVVKLPPRSGAPAREIAV